MSLRSTTLVDRPRTDPCHPWTERLELIQFHGGLQLTVLQIVSADLNPMELWISRECRRPQELGVAIGEWALARSASPQQLEQAWSRCRDALSEWGPMNLREAGTVTATPLRAQRRP